MINTGIFPDSLKIAKVKPIFNKNCPAKLASVCVSVCVCVCVCVCIY